MTRQPRTSRSGAEAHGRIVPRSSALSPPRLGLLPRFGFLLLLAVTAVALISESAQAKVESTDSGIRFSFGDDRAREVFVAGNFNDWNATANPMILGDDGWSVTIEFDPGEYEYKFVVDGQWVADPDNPTTVGEFGNSALNIAADGSIVALQATSNTALSPKILMGGRAIALYKYRKDDVQDRFELDRPNLDFDIDFNVRINSDLDAHLLTNVSNDAENVEFFETRLNFDRGSLTLDNNEIFLQAWDNEGVADWGDPLGLVGRVGIYDHLFGYGTVGARASKTFAGFEAELLYTDDSDLGAGFPAVSEDFGDIEGIFEVVDGRARLTVDHFSSYSINASDGAEDVFAGRVSRDLDEWVGKPLSVSLLGRLDRGYSPGAAVAFDLDPGDDSRTRGTAFTIDEGYEAWGAFGGAVSYEASENLRFRGQYLRGESWIQVKSGEMAPLELVTTITDTDTLFSFVADESQVTPADDVDLDTSNRAFLGVTLPNTLFGLTADLSWEYEDHALAPVVSGVGRELESDLSTYRLDLSREWDELPGLGRPGSADLRFEYYDFTYEKDAPWATQIWFDDRNFWLERGEHDVSFDRLTLLGGDDAFIWKPRFDVRFPQKYEIGFTYEGTLGSDAIGSTPKYFESLFKLRGTLSRDWALYLDSRLVRYDVPAIEFDGTFFSTFFEVAYEPVDGVSLALSWGVDPYVIDGPVNEYAYIGRDQFLFGEGANAGAARDDFLGLGERIRAAEELLEDENRIQLEARLDF